MEMAVKAAAVGVVAAIGALLIKKNNPELAAVVAVCACVVIAAAVLGALGDIVDFLDDARELSGMSPALFSPVLKCVGIGIIARVGSDICRDAGSTGAATCVELAGMTAAVLAALPLFRALLDILEDMV